MARYWIAQLALVSLDIFLIILLVMANTDFCGSVFVSQVDHFLFGQVIERASVADEFECHLKCLGNNSCKSFNVHPDGNNENHICELNNNTRQMKPGHFKWKTGSTYYGSVQISCIDGSHTHSKPTQKRECHPGFTGRRCSVMKGSHHNHPARSCKDIRELGGSNQDGEYWIDPENNGNPLKVYCDLTTDGGGWLLIINIVIDDDPPTYLNTKTSYHGITHYNDNKMFLTPLALNELRTYLPFTQLRFHCSKQHGRTFHVTTVANSTGEAVVQFFSRQTSGQPDACGSFVRLNGDTSYLASDCARWGIVNGTFKAGKWGRQSVSGLRAPAFISKLCYWITNPLRNVWLCDDGHGTPVSRGDFWKVYVR